MWEIKQQDPVPYPNPKLKRCDASFQRPKTEPSRHYLALRLQSESPHLDLSSPRGPGATPGVRTPERMLEHLHLPPPQTQPSCEGHEGGAEKGGVGTSVQACNHTCVLTVR